MAKLHDAPARLILVGMMGCGKTTVGRLLSERLGRPFVDLDDAIEARTHSTVADLFAEHGEFDFRACEAHVLRDLPRRYPEVVLATGGGTPLHFDNMDYLSRIGLTVFLDIDAEHLVARLANQRDARPLLHREDWEKYLRELTAERRPVYERAEVTVEVTGGHSERAADNILAALPQIVGH